ncbi:hypothetical protein EJD97_001913 [Solanum chilense]|uniref:Uncharacterized protein n=1 Tax=Solanum chilense TaxID=4083 RepID=A0A6N2BYU0_SOLCI|nr:hypothetical protein EJD97_001913 [Solanum chilense]
MDYYNEEVTPSSASNSTIAHIVDGCVAMIFGIFALFCLFKCCCYTERVFSSEKIEMLSIAPVGDQHDHSRLVIMPGDQNPTCIATPVSSPCLHLTQDG